MLYTRGKHFRRMSHTGEGVWRILHIFLGCACAITLLSGCGSDQGPERVVVSGLATYNGKPVPDGIIRFVPDKSASKPMMATVIKDGKYNAEGLGGVPTGTHKVQIEAMRAVRRGPPPKPGEPAPLHADGLQQYIPQKYNAKTQLEITVPPGSGPITKNFDLAD